ncbi:E3 ubiquitin-protein ligase RNF19A-like isoform X1 [Pecten maximus]|uniref:E3 ubiquitin-protein ligase RNF19A-like isoform X1 n=1 Tax=Pecten maximus TaxID=6579 RepID=UPI0014585059|nr:E3 ubiquitin-protein ligase RNF19A-like isoform X1 [Pecten maximus]
MKKRDSEVVSVSSANSKGSERRRNGTRFSLRRIFYPTGSRRSRSRVSLDSDSGRSEMSLSVPSDRDSITQHSITSGAQTQVVSCKPTVNGGSVRECPLCLTERQVEDFPEIMTCHHRSCITCLQTYLKIEITESRINISCPECTEKFHPNDIRLILQNDSLMGKYEDFMVRRVLVSDPDARWCPAPDCGYAVIATGCAGCPKLRCERPGCDTNFCYHCKQHWHPNKTCDAARAERSPNMRSASLSYSHDNDSQKDDIKPCPRCGAFIMKMNDGSCNHMACPVCGAEFCWLCMKEISDLHYLSPSGCTFWGKKPWSRKKKILWQLGTLVGAPVGITLIAGIAVPAMVIGLPVWVGRKLHSKYEHSSRHKRNMAITGGVTASILVSPVIAGLAVGIGVPILLAYVYGVVPISLCRSGGCGVTTTNKGGVRFDFDENETAGQPSVYAGDNQSVGTGHNVANPSIAPSIGEASVGMTGSLSASGSHMERVGVIRDESDRDSASNRALAGSSLNGSLCGGSYVVGCFQNKLEVQADMVSMNNTPLTKRNSFSSESANLSIGEKSTTISFSDDASTKALAGSIAGYRDKDSASITTTSPYEVQVDVVSQSSRGRNNSGGSASLSAISSENRNRNTSGQSSPTSGCSTNMCVGSEETKNNSFKCRKCKRFNGNHCDKVTDQCGVHFAEKVSLQNFQTDDIVSPTLSEEFVKYNSKDSTRDVVQTKLSDPFIENSAALADTTSEDTLPEVESDRPSSAKKLISAPNRKSMSTSALMSECWSASDGSLCKSQSQEDYMFTKMPLMDGARLRRLSCELARENGRISPPSDLKDCNSESVPLK